MQGKSQWEKWLQSHWSTWWKMVEPNDVLPLLRGCGCLSVSTIQKIERLRDNGGQREAASHLMAEVQRVGPRAIKAFMLALHRSDSEVYQDLIDEVYQNIPNDLRAEIRKELAPEEGYVPEEPGAATQKIAEEQPETSEIASSALLNPSTVNIHCENLHLQQGGGNVMSVSTPNSNTGAAPGGNQGASLNDDDMYGSGASDDDDVVFPSDDTGQDDNIATQNVVVGANGDANHTPNVNNLSHIERQESEINNEQINSSTMGDLRRQRVQTNPSIAEDQHSPSNTNYNSPLSMNVPSSEPRPLNGTHLPNNTAGGSSAAASNIVDDLSANLERNLVSGQDKSETGVKLIHDLPAVKGMVLKETERSIEQRLGYASGGQPLLNEGAVANSSTSSFNPSSNAGRAGISGAQPPFSRYMGDKEMADITLSSQEGPTITSRFGRVPCENDENENRPKSSVSEGQGQDERPDDLSSLNGNVADERPAFLSDISEWERNSSPLIPATVPSCLSHNPDEEGQNREQNPGGPRVTASNPRDSSFCVGAAGSQRSVTPEPGQGNESEEELSESVELFLSDQSLPESQLEQDGGQASSFHMNFASEGAGSDNLAKIPDQANVNQTKENGNFTWTQNKTLIIGSVIVGVIAVCSLVIFRKR